LSSGAGYIGSFTALALLEADYKVVIVDNLYNSSKEVINRIELICGKKPEFYEADITDEAALDKVFDDHPDIDNVIHFAALKVSMPLPPSVTGPVY
jgi:UDP-glucose 4-epimerase